MERYATPGRNVNTDGLNVKPGDDGTNTSVSDVPVITRDGVIKIRLYEPTTIGVLALVTGYRVKLTFP